MSRHAGPLGVGVSFPESFLAVDLFFLLSGFVIAYAYDGRLARPSFVGQFLGIRLIRLYPLYLLGIAVGACYRRGSVLGHTEGWTAGRLGAAVLAGVLLWPSTPLTSASSSDLDGPTWTLLPEIIANMIYALCFRWMTRWVLTLVVAAGALGLVACRFWYGTIDAGWELSQWPVMASRLAFSFFGGVLLFRLLGDRRRTRPWVAWLCVLGVGAALSSTLPEGTRAVGELACVLAGFPLVVWVACQNEPGRFGAHLFRLLGLVSYAVYVLHQPASTLFAKLIEHGAHMPPERVATPALALFISGLVVAAWLVDKYYDTPVRRWLGMRWARRAVIATAS